MKADSRYAIIQQQDGFTLVEALVALMILTVGILSVNAMQIGAINTNVRANRVTQSTSWAMDKVEYLMNLPYSDVKLTDTDLDGTDQDANLDGTDDDGGNFGLDHVNANGNINADHTATSADGLFTIFWNIALDQPMVGSKTIRIIVTRPKENRTRDTVITYIKTVDFKANGSTE